METRGQSSRDRAASRSRLKRSRCDLRRSRRHQSRCMKRTDRVRAGRRHGVVPCHAVAAAPGSPERAQVEGRGQCCDCRRAAIPSVQESSDFVSPVASLGGCRGTVAASRHAVGADVAADGDAGDPEQPGGRPHREPVELRLLDRLPAGELTRSGRTELLAPGFGSRRGTVARLLRRRGGREHVEPPGCAPGAEPRGDALVVGVLGQPGASLAQHPGPRRCRTRGDGEA